MRDKFAEKIAIVAGIPMKLGVELIRGGTDVIWGLYFF